MEFKPTAKFELKDAKDVLVQLENERMVQSKASSAEKKAYRICMYCVESCAAETAKLENAYIRRGNRASYLDSHIKKHHAWAIVVRAP